MPSAAVGSFFHTPGPKELYVRCRQNGSGVLQAVQQAVSIATTGTDWQFLGTCVTAPDISQYPKHIDVYNDYGGRSVPTQLIWDGSESRVAVTVNRLDLAVARNIRDQAERIGTLGRVGRETNLDRGSLEIGVSDMELIFRNTYYGTVNATPGLPIGRWYFSTVLEAYEEHTTGTRVEEVSMLFRCNNYYLGGNGHAQFTEDASEFPTLIPN
jgi:hypothetical protein